MNRTYVTERLVLKVIAPEYAQGVLDFYEVNKTFLEPWEHMKSPTFFTLSHQQKTLEVEERSFCKGQMVRFWLYLKEDDLFVYPIGTIALTNIIRGAFQSCFLGYKIHINMTRKGYMTEALRKVISIAFEEMNLHRLEANIMPCNLASLSLVKKLGFHEEGLAIQYSKVNGKWEDHLHWVLLNKEY